MATTITNDYGTFTGETEAEALKLAKAGKRAYEKREREAEALKAVALTRAEAAGFRVLCMVASNGVPRGWALEQATAPGGIGPVWAKGTEDGNEIYEVETADGRGTFSLWRGSFRAVLMNGAGFAVAVVAKGYDHDEHVYAVGVNGGYAEMTRIPGIAPELFRKRGEKLAAAV